MVLIEMSADGGVVGNPCSHVDFQRCLRVNPCMSAERLQKFLQCLESVGQHPEII